MDLLENISASVWIEALGYSLLWAYLFLGVGYFIVKWLRGIVNQAK